MKNQISDVLGQMNQLNRSLVDSGSRTTEVVLRAQAQFIRQQVILAQMVVDSGIRQLEAFGSAISPADLVERQATVAADLSNKMAESVQELFDCQNQTGDELLQCMEDGIEEVGDNPLLAGTRVTGRE
jgi:predicted TIM-barrel enzyme